MVAEEVRDLLHSQSNPFVQTTMRESKYNIFSISSVVFCSGNAYNWGYSGGGGGGAGGVIFSLFMVTAGTSYAGYIACSHSILRDMFVKELLAYILITNKGNGS